MPRLRQFVKQGALGLIVIAAVLMALFAVADWSRPPQNQASVVLYEKIVTGPYRRLIHPISTRVVRCRYVPTCSSYSVEAVRRHGLPKGVWITVARLFRCLPTVPMNSPDPVPPAGATKHSHW